MSQPLSAQEISRVARQLFQGAPAAQRLMQTYRPFICPFELLLPWVPPAAKMLDVGCGAGLVLGVLGHLRGIASGYGIDASRGAIDVARAMASRNGLSDILQLEPASSLTDIPENAFDAVSLIDVLHHVPPVQQREFFLNVARRVKPGGCLIFKDIAERPRLFAFCNTMHDVILAHEVPHYVAQEKVMSWAQTAGLEIGRTGIARRFWYVHWFALLRKPR